jgi:hypothetical protein
MPIMASWQDYLKTVQQAAAYGYCFWTSQPGAGGAPAAAQNAVVIKRAASVATFAVGDLKEARRNTLQTSLHAPSLHMSTVPCTHMNLPRTTCWPCPMPNVCHYLCSSHAAIAKEHGHIQWQGQQTNTVRVSCIDPFANA